MKNYEFFPCRNPECDEGFVRYEVEYSGSWSTCPECNGAEGDWREVDDSDDYQDAEDNN